MSAKTIKISELEDGYLLFKVGKTTLAKGIRWFQRLKYPDAPKYITDQNHTGNFDDIEGQMIVFEQDNPGKFQGSDFLTEYADKKEEVWVGVPKDTLHPHGLKEMLRHERRYAGEDVWSNYSYRSYFGFMVNAVVYRLSKGKWDIWVTGKPKGTTCSQIMAFMYNKYFSWYYKKPYFMYFPCEIAMSDKIELRKLVY